MRKTIFVLVAASLAISACSDNSGEVAPPKVPTRDSRISEEAKVIYIRCFDAMSLGRDRGKTCIEGDLAGIDAADREKIVAALPLQMQDVLKN